ncbi:MAG: S9 family peptidase [Betaproteobacteria bacterium]|nr:MAG: S9 family peptidase [Betaproteobacteria bacterium]TAG47618.1 MAG: S9 family peptidase [Betaproteobacteria bacterium]
MRSKLAAALMTTLLFCSAVFAQAPQLTVEDIWKSPTMAGLTLSRSGKYLAATAPHNGRMNLMVLDMETRKGSVLTSFEDFDVRAVRWVGDERLVFSLGQANSPTGPGQFDGGGLFVIGRDGKGSRRLAPTVREAREKSQRYRSLTMVRTIPGTTDEIIAAGNQTTADSEDLYRLNLNTGRLTLLTAGRPADRTSDWILDEELVPRIVTVRIKDQTNFIVYHRASATAPWEELARFGRTTGKPFVPLLLEKDGFTLQVATNPDRDTLAVYRYDIRTKKLGEMLAGHPTYDMGANAEGDNVAGVLYDSETRRLNGYVVDAAIPQRVWLDADYAKTQKTLDTALPGMTNSFRRIPNSKRQLVSSYSDVKPLRWFILDEEKLTLEPLGEATPWLENKLVEQRPFTFKTRDGLEIPGYLFLPKDYKAGTKLPTIVHIHGGPSVRADSYASGFGYLEGQLFASRGYAVIVPNFRVTPGLGQKIYAAGFGTVGRQMSEDHEDALKWAIEQGYTDPKRVCMSGASYGGYAGLQALAKTPELFKCAVAGLAVTDLYYQLTTVETDFVNEPAAVDFWRDLLGVKDFGEPIVKAISPVNYAEKIKGAVFLYAGRDDVRVPINQIYRMDRALKAAGNPPKAFVIKEKEGHGFGKLENNIDLYNQILNFLEDQLKR